MLYDILDTPVSPELLPPDENGNIAQKTEENIGPYELHDFFLYNFVRFGFSKEKLIMLAQKAFEDKYSPAVIEKWASVFMRRFFISQFKRGCIRIRRRSARFRFLLAATGACRATLRLTHSFDLCK